MSLLRQSKIITGAVSGTTVMTLSSYMLSWVSNNNFKEPQILSQLIIRLLNLPKKKFAQITGWSLHYLVGLLFAELYAPIWEKTALQPTTKNGLILGGISGFAAILVWKFTLSFHPDPPSINFWAFAAQLFAVHLIFGAFNSIGYNIIE